VWAKISNSATKMACVACIAVAATLPAAGSTAEQIANENARLAAFTDVDAFSAIPSYLGLLGGNPAAVAGLDSLNGLPALLALLGGNPDLLLPDDTNAGYAALSAIDVFFGDGANGAGGVFTGGGIAALSNYDALSAIPAYATLLDPTATTADRLAALGSLDSVSAIPVFVAAGQAAAAGRFTGPNSVASALGGYDALSAVDTFFGDGPVGADGVTPIGGVFTGGGIDALAPSADGSGGYAALSGLPVFFGPDTSGNAPFGPGVFTGGGIGALSNYDALSAIPAYLDPAPAPFAATQNAAPQPQTFKAAADPAVTTTTPPTGSNPVKTFVASLPKPDFTPPAPQVFTPPAPPKEEPKIEAAASPGDNSGPRLNVTTDSTKATPTDRHGGDSSSPFWLQNGGSGADNGIRGWGSMLKKAGLGGGSDAGTGGSAGGTG
jgi:hypothetical protein